MLCVWWGEGYLVLSVAVVVLVGTSSSQVLSRNSSGGLLCL